MLLSGLTVMVTRPKPQGEALCQHIRAAGGVTVYFPTMEIIPPESPHILKNELTKLAQYDIVIFVSPQAVQHTTDMIHEFPKHIKVAAIGRSTAEALKNAKLPVHVYPESDWTSEGLLALPLFQQVQGKKIAIIQGETGREMLEEVLTKRGAVTKNVIAYRRVIPIVDVQPYKDLLHKHKIDIIICTSNEIVQNLVTLLGVQAVPLLVISERMFHFAKKLGFNHVFLAKNASHDAIISELVRQKDQLCQMKKKQM